MELIKFGYANGTHYCDKDSPLVGGNYSTYWLLVTNAGNVIYQNGYDKHTVPIDVLVQAGMEAIRKKKEYQKQWNRKSIYEKWCTLLDYFYEKPITNAKEISDSYIMKVEQFIEKYEGNYLKSI